MTTVVLSDIEMELAALVGVKRLIESKANNRKDTFKPKGCEWGVDIDGAAAEMAYCKFRDKFWTGSIGSFKKADQGRNVQIRHTRYHDGHLVVRPRDPNDHYYVLVKGTAPRLTIVGWILGSDAKQQQFLRTFREGESPAYFVPQQDLHKFKEGANEIN